MNRRILINLVVFAVVFGVMCVWAVRNVVTFDAIEKPYEIHVDLAAASGIAPNAEVAYLGVHYGRVGDVDLVPGGVEATLKIDRDRRIPRGSVARLFRKSAIGEPYIDFQPPDGFGPDAASDDDYYAAGDTVPIEDTQNPIEFSELLRTASRLISSIEPERAATLLHELALALDGRGDDLREMTTSIDELSATFAERTDVLDRLATNNTRLTAVLSDHRGSLGQSLSDLAAVADSLHNASGDTQVLLDRGAALLDQVGSLIDDTRPDLDCILDDLVAVNAMTAQPERLQGLAHHLEIGPAAYGLLANTQDVEADGPWVRVNLEIGLGEPADQYDPPLSLPAVPQVAPCPSGVQAEAASGAVVTDDVSASDFVPSEVLAETRSGALPTSGAGVAASVAVVAALAAVLVRRLHVGSR